MKFGWEQKQLGELAELRGRIGWRGLTAKEYTETGPLFLSVHSLNYGDYVDYRDAFHISEERYLESPEIVLQRDDVLICKDGAGIGKVGIVGELPDRATINSSLLLIRAGEELLPKFLFRCLSSPYFQEIVSTRLNGATTPHLYQRDITEFPIVLPPIAEQRRIVNILDKAFESIAIARANSEKNLQNARELFERQRNEVFARRGTGYSKKKLSQVCGINSQLVDPRLKEFADLIHVGAGNMESETGGLGGLQTASEEKLISGKFPFEDSAVLYSKIRPYLRKVARPNFAGLCSADVYPLEPDCNHVTRDYLFHLLLSSAFTEYAIQGSARAGMPKVNRDHLFEFGSWLPDVRIQRELSSMLDGLQLETRRLESTYCRKLAAFNELQQSLLHQVFSGQL